MASGVITTVSLMDELAIIFLDSSNQMFTESEYAGFILRHVDSNESSYTAQQAIGNYYYVDTNPYLLGPSFTADDDTSYTVRGAGSTIEVTSGTHTGDTISITGASINFKLVVADICDYIATNAAKKASTVFAGGDGQWSIDDVHKKIVEIRNFWVGAVPL